MSAQSPSAIHTPKRISSRRVGSLQLGDLPQDEFEAGRGREARLIAALAERQNVVWLALGFATGWLVNHYAQLRRGPLALPPLCPAQHDVDIATPAA